MAVNGQHNVIVVNCNLYSLCSNALNIYICTIRGDSYAQGYEYCYTYGVFSDKYADYCGDK